MSTRKVLVVSEAIITELGRAMDTSLSVNYQIWCAV
jgi:hypothetical protein